MLKTEFLTCKSSTKGDQETASASSTATPYTVESCDTAPANLEATPEQKHTAIVSNIIDKDNFSSQKSPQSMGESSFEQSEKESIIKLTLLVEPSLPNDDGNMITNKVPMVMGRAPYKHHTFKTIPESSAFKYIREKTSPPQISMDNSKNEQQARDLLSWNNGIGTLEGCDLQFRINQLGCLELLDSDDEGAENHRSNINSSHEKNATKNPYQSNSNLAKKASTSSTSSSSLTTTKTKTPNLATTNATLSNGTHDSYNSCTNEGLIRNNNNGNKKVKLESGSSASTKQISPGSSLLRDGPNMRRPRTLSSNYTTTPNIIRGNPTNNLALQRRIEHYQNTILLEKLVPKQKLEEIKSNVEKWSVEDVRIFVDSIPGCAGSGELFESQQICGKSLLYLDQRDLLDVINVKLGPAVKIYHAISLLK